MIQADVAMQQDPSLAWAFIVDDDAYVRTTELAALAFRVRLEFNERIVAARTDALSSFLLPKDGKGKHGTVEVLRALGRTTCFGP